MTLLLVSLLVALGIGAWVVHPLVARRAAMLRDVDSGELLDARARRGVTFAALKELEYEYLGGKLDEDDYAALRARLQREALDAARAAGSAEADAAALSRRHGCGFGNPSGSRFCGGCGAPLGA